MLLEEPFCDDAGELLDGPVPLALSKCHDLVGSRTVFNGLANVVILVGSALDLHLDVDPVSVADHPLLGRNPMVCVELEAADEDCVHAREFTLSGKGSEGGYLADA